MAGYELESLINVLEISTMRRRLTHIDVQWCIRIIVTNVNHIK